MIKVASNEYTQDHEGFDYLVAGGEYPQQAVHHISIQCANFKPFNWEGGDRLVVEATDVEWLFPGQVHAYSVVLEAGQSDQCAVPDLTLRVALASFAAAAGIEFVDEDLDPGHPYIVRDADSLFVADNDE
jgi:hypothetical protein